MNNSPDDRTRLVAETLDGDWAAGPAATMARRAAASARRRHALKRVALPLAAVVALGAVILLGQRRESPGTLPFVASPAGTATASPVAHAGYEIISDDELAATLSDRPLLVLPQENGSKKIVLLDR